MQNAGFAAAGLDWVYVPLPTKPEDLATAVAGLAAAGFAGANVTIPHKQAVVGVCDDLDDVAAQAGSVNTLVFEGGRIVGHSTDGAAVVDRIDAVGRRALVLGAGGSARAVVSALEHAGADVVVATRHDDPWPPSVDGFDVIVNCTPVKDELLVLPTSDMQVVDLAYLPDGEETALVAQARLVGCEVIVDGLDILLGQGAAAFRLWTGLEPPVGAMRTALGR